MARTILHFDNGGTREPKTRTRTTGVKPAADTLEVYPGENIRSVSIRAYGSNTAANRAKLMSANSEIAGTIRVPR